MASILDVAGGEGRPGATDGAGASARFRSPRGITNDGVSLFVADTGNHTIRRIALNTGDVTTLAGAAGRAGASDGVGEAARFDTPVGLATDGDSLYVTDAANHAVRRVVIATGVVTTLAGRAGEPGAVDGQGHRARFRWPEGIAVDGRDLFVGDSDNVTVRCISLATGEVSTLAGRAGEGGIVRDGEGASVSFGAVVSYARTGGLRAAAAGGGFLYLVDDADEGYVRRIDIVRRTSQTLVRQGWQRVDGPAQERLPFRPNGIAVDGGWLYLTERDAVSVLDPATCVRAVLAGEITRPPVTRESSSGNAASAPRSGRRVRVALHSNPLGATVRVGSARGPVLGVTPCEGVVLRSRSTRLVFSLEGHQARDVDVDPRRERVITVAMLASPVTRRWFAGRDGPRGLTVVAGVVYLLDEHTVRRIGSVSDKGPRQPALP